MLGVAGAGAILLFVGGLWIYISATAVPIHPTADSVTSVTQTEASQQWSSAVERSRQVVRAGLSEQNLPGVSVAVGVGGDLVWTEGFGFADLEKKTPVTPGTRFRLGTASIPLTSAAAGLLIERKQLGLDETIQTYVPEFPEKPWPVTVRELMGHTSGLITDDGDEGPLFGKHCDRAVEALPAFADAKLHFEPGTQYYYSRFSWVLLSAAIETAADDHLLRFMNKEIFDPLGMTDTLAESTAETIEDFATPYFPRFAADPRYGPDPMRPLDLSCYAGSSAFVSTSPDLVRFALAINNGKLLQPDTVKLLQTPVRTADGKETGYGLGWDIETVSLNGQPARAVGHDGELLGGTAVTLMTFPDRGLVIAVLSNTSYAATPALAIGIAEAFTSQR